MATGPDFSVHPEYREANENCRKSLELILLAIFPNRSVGAHFQAKINLAEG